MPHQRNMILRTQYGSTCLWVIPDLSVSGRRLRVPEESRTLDVLMQPASNDNISLQQRRDNVGCLDSFWEVQLYPPISIPYRPYRK